MSKPLIAQSWLDLKPVGDVIQGTRFVAFKIPMSKDLFESNRISRDKYFTPKQLVKHIESNGKRIGLVIDLSSGSGYYDPSKLRALGIREYVKLKTRKKTLIDERQKFVKIVNKFLKDHPNQDELIGVHCYHGLQRTAYMICSYMVTENNIDVESAIKSFESARGHEIDRARKWLRDDSTKGFANN